MSMVHYEGMNLDDVVRQSRWILAVRKAKPLEKAVLVPIHEDTIRYKPFHRVFYRFEVTGTLHASDGKDLTGTTIEAAHWHTDTALECARLYQVQGIAKSPIHRDYESSANFRKEDELILFLSGLGKDGYRFIAYESPARKDDVLASLGRLPKA